MSEGRGSEVSRMTILLWSGWLFPPLLPYAWAGLRKSCDPDLVSRHLKAMISRLSTFLRLGTFEARNILVHPWIFFALSHVKKCKPKFFTIFWNIEGAQLHQASFKPQGKYRPRNATWWLCLQWETLLVSLEEGSYSQRYQSSDNQHWPLFSIGES